MKKAYTPKTPSRKREVQKESLQVFCRLRPKGQKELSCIKIISSTAVQLTIPESSKNYKTGSGNEYQFSFKRVFTDVAPQKEVFDEVALPLVYQLIKGQNGLLFTYGVTGSGKTYTMTGAKRNAGIMPRCLDVLFNSISDYQAKKYVFKPDRMNGFDVQSEEDARQDRDNSLKNVASKYGKLRKKESQEDLTSSRSKEDLRIEMVEEDNAYAVFVTYVEIYNNIAYDLLESTSEGAICPKSHQRTVIREDANGNMYVHGVTEVEVKSAEEAFEVFYRGQNRKRMAHTSLNAESSRSHSIFTIRLVQAPLDMNGENVVQEKKLIGISQLSLVDLAGVERTNRTGNQGQRLGEAGHINTSLMKLRQCLEILRENQQTGGLKSKMIPFRDNRLTLLFKNYFEGEGNIRMVVCVNPRFEDCDENFQVMQFAEASQEIMVKPTPMKTDFSVGLTPGRRRANQAYKKALKILEDVKEQNPVAYIPDDAEEIYVLEPFPTFENADPMNEEYNKKLLTFLEERVKRKERLREDLFSRIEKFRASLLQRNEDFTRLKQDCDAANARLETTDSKTKVLEERLVSLNSYTSTLKRKCDDYADEIRKLKLDIEIKDQLINQCNVEKDREKMRTRKMAAKTEKLVKEKENNLKEKQNIEFQLKEREKRLRRVKKVLDIDEAVGTRSKIPRLNNDCHSDTESSTTSSSHEAPGMVTPMMKQRLRPRTVNTIAVSNPRYGNRKCNTHDQWLEHRQAIVAPLNTVLQPVLKKTKSFSSVTSPKDMTKNTKYCLMTQNQDPNGDIETQLFKGDVVKTAGGGAQVIFHDVETLKQLSPVTSPRKQSVDELNTSISNKNTVRFV